MSKRPGDWDCKSCGDTQFARNKECRQCGAAAPKSAGGPSASSSSKQKPGDWNCSKCGDLQFARNAKCRQCNTPKAEVVDVAPETSSSSSSTNKKPGDWNCSKCGDHQFARNEKCRQCGTAKAKRASPDDAAVEEEKEQPAAKKQKTTTATGAKYYLAIDIESAGRSYHHHVNGLGFYFGPCDRTLPNAVYAKTRWGLEPMPGQGYEKACEEEFWSKFPEVKQGLEAFAEPAYAVMGEFYNQVKGLVKLVGAGNIKILSDCPDFDLGRLDELGYRTGTWTDPIRYLTTETRHQLRDPGERLDMLGPKAREDCKKWIAQQCPRAKHSHFPDDDAEYEYWQQLYCDAHKPQQ